MKAIDVFKNLFFVAHLHIQTMRQYLNMVFLIPTVFLLYSCSDAITKLSDPGDSVLSSADDSGVSLELREAYWDDASILAVRQINLEGGILSNKVELPQDRIRFYYEVLVHVHNAKRLSSRDKVVTTHRIHAHESPRLRELSMSVADTVAWVQPWMNGNRFTGNPAVDSLLQAYDLAPSRVQHALDQYGVVLIAGRPLNIIALGTLFEKIPGVIFAVSSLDRTDIMPTDIWAKVSSNKTVVHFYKSIPIHREWCFSVYAYGLVVFEYSG